MELIETKSPYVSRHWYCDQSIVLFSIQKDNRVSVDLFADWIIETVLGWERTKPLMIAYDISAASMLTPHVMRRSMDVYDAVPTEGIVGRTAIIYGRNGLGGFFVTFAEKVMRVQNTQMQRQFFRQTQPAVDWLTKELAVIKNNPLDRAG